MMSVYKQKNSDDKDGPQFLPNSDVVSQRVGNDVVLVHLKSNRIFELNVTGARLWELISFGHNITEIEREMIRDFDVEPERLARDINEMLASLKKEELLGHPSLEVG